MLQMRKTEEHVMEHFSCVLKFSGIFFRLSHFSFLTLYALHMICACVYTLRAEFCGNQKPVTDAVDTG